MISRKAFNEEIDLVNILHQLRFSMAVFKTILPDDQYNSLKESTEKTKISIAVKAPSKTPYKLQDREDDSMVEVPRVQE